MQKRPKISIIIPVYNAEKYISKCLNSILNQTEKNFEVIIVDDGSRDDSLKKCKYYKNMDNRIKVIHQENSGVSKARNLGIEFSTGKYTVFIDIDDYIHKQYLEKLLEKQEQCNAELVCSGYIAEKNLKRKDKVKYPEKIVYEEDMVLEFLDFFKTIANAPWGKLYKTDIIKKFNIRFPEDMPYAEDTIFNMKYYSNISKLIISSDTKYFYNCKDNGSAMKKYYPDMCHYLYKVFLQKQDFFRKKDQVATFEKIIVDQQQFYFEWCMKHYIQHCNTYQNIVEKLKQTKELFVLASCEKNTGWRYQQLLREEKWKELISLWKKNNMKDYVKFLVRCKKIKLRK